MNQILLTKNILKTKLKKFKIQFFLSVFITISLSIYLAYFYYTLNKSEKISGNFLNIFYLESLYNSYNNYTVVELNSQNNSYIIGIIEIPKINIKYPIFSKTSDELLKISVCKFYGPSSNEIGNLCIAGHNYDDNRFFGNLNKLSIGDKITIYDVNNMSLDYYVYDKYETDVNDSSCTKQENNNLRQITLITCNNINKNRLIVKACE